MKALKYLSFVIAAVMLLCTLSACEFKMKLKPEAESTTTVSVSQTEPAEEQTETVTEVETQTDASGVVVTDKAGEPVTKITTKTQKKSTTGSEEFFKVEDAKKSEKEEINKDRIKEKEKEKEEKKQDDIKIIENKKYTIKGRMFTEEGEVSEFKMAQNGDNFALITSYDTMPLGVILKDENIILLDIGAETYFTVPLSALDEDGKAGFMDLIQGNVTEDDEKVVKEGTETVDGVELSYKEYESGSKSYFKGNTLVLTKSDDGTLVYIDELVEDADESLFTPPESFDKVELDAETLKKYTQ